MRTTQTVATLLLLPAMCLAAWAAPSVSQYEYDANGNLTKLIDPLNRATVQSYDALNRLTQVTDAAGGTTRYQYDALSQLTGVTDPRNLTTVYRYDGLGNQVQTASPDTGTSNRQFDVAGNLTGETDAKGNTAAYRYDGLNRLIEATYTPAAGGAPLVIAYRYDEGANGIGRLTGIDGPGDQTLRYSYDARGRLTAEARSLAGSSYTTRYAYDAGGRLAGITYPSGRIVRYGFDANGRIARIEMEKGGVVKPLVSQVQYQPFGGVQGFSFANGERYSRSYDLEGRMSSYSAGGSNRNLNYDAAGNIVGIVDAAQPSAALNLGYDALNRVTSASSPAGSYSYGYDAVGNRTAKNGESYSYASDSNRLLQAGTTNHQYDANGSLIAQGPLGFDYDARGRLVKARTAQGEVTYLVNALGQRVAKEQDGKRIVYHYDREGRLLGETDPAGRLAKEYVYLYDQPVYVVAPKNAAALFDDSGAVFEGLWSTVNDPRAVGGSYRRYQRPGGAR